MDDPNKFAARLYGRRDFLRNGAGLCFVVPVLRNGLLGQPALAPKAAPAVPWFTEVAQRSGLAAFRDTCGSAVKDYLVETIGSGVALFDYNNDGLLDVLLVNGSTLEILHDPSLPRTSSRLFRNNGDGTFTDVTKSSGLVNQGWGMGVAVADFDNDGHADVFITNYGANALFRNNGNGTFTNITREAGLEGGNWSTGCAWGDYDGDGRLDLYVSRYVDFDPARIPRPGTAIYCLYRGVPVACGPLGLPGLADLFYHNEGGGKFREVSNDVGIRDTDKAYGLGVVWCDFDNDGLPDIYVANDSMPSYLWHNKGNGTFEEIGMQAGCAVSADGRPQSSMGVAVGDYNNDGWMDLLVTNFSEDYSTLFRNTNGRFDDVTFEAGLGTVSYKNLKWGVGFVDYDNDGWKDLLVANGHIYPQADKAGNSYHQQNQLFRNLRNGRFALLDSAESGFTEAWSSRGAAFGDLDNGGRVWAVVNNIDEEPFLYKPQGTAGAWVRLKLTGTGTKSNRDAIGARVRVTAGGITQTDEVRAGESYLSSCDPRLHFGLGQAGTIDRVEIRWPDGQQEKHESLAVNREYAFRQAEKSAKG
jgi:enediyne biosynthesis protein E4